MEADAIAQLVTLLMVGLGIVWHQQRSTDKLREEFHTAIRGLREEFHTAINTGLRELRQDHNKLRDDVAGIGQRLARIEGFLAIGIPSPPDESTGAEPD